LIIGVGVILFQNGTTSSFIETVKSMGLWILIPIIFIIIGVFQIIKSLFFERSTVYPIIENCKRTDEQLPKR